MKAIAATPGKKPFFPLGLARSRPGAASHHLAVTQEMLLEPQSEAIPLLPPTENL